MSSLRVSGSALALLVSVLPALGEPVLSFDGTDFEATMGYNTANPADWPTSQSESTPPGPVDSLVFPNASIYQNYLFEEGTPIDQAWCVLAEQSYEGGSEYPTLHYTFERIYASPILATYPLMIGLQHVNDTLTTDLAMSGPVAGTFTYNVPGARGVGRLPQTLPWSLDDGWIWTATSDGQYNLEVDFGIPHVQFPLLPAGAQIYEVAMEFKVAPEPATLWLFALSAALVGKRRR